MDLLKARRLARALRPVPSLLALLALLSPGCASRPTRPLPGQGPDSYRFDVGVAPVPDRDRLLGGTVTATEISTRRAITTPRFEVAWGASETVSANDPGTRTRLKATLTVDKAGTELICEASVSRDGLPPVFHRSYIALRK